MTNTRKDDDLRIVRERQDFIDSQVKFLKALRGHQDEWIIWARQSGATYAELGAALGVSWQAAEKRHSVAVAKRTSNHDSPVAGP